jgi:tetratricopeptide (TPR) repeat protein
LFYQEEGKLSIGDDCEAVHTFDEAIMSFMTMSGDPMDGAETAVSLDNSFIMAHVLVGMTKLLQGGASCRSSLEACEALVKLDTATESERFHVAALRAWSAGRLRKAASLWECVLFSDPHDALALKFSHDTYYILGDSKGTFGSVARVLPYWEPSMPAYSALLSMHAYSLVGIGSYAAAQEAADRALSLEPADAWAAHAMASALGAQGFWSEGLSFLRNQREFWESNGEYHQFFRPMLEWQRIQFMLDQGSGYTEGLDVIHHYDMEFADLPADKSNGRGLSGHFSHAITCPAALLWEIEFLCADINIENEDTTGAAVDTGGVDTGDRWAELLQSWEAAAGESTDGAGSTDGGGGASPSIWGTVHPHTPMLADVHRMMALAAAGDNWAPQADAFEAALRQFAAKGVEGAEEGAGDREVFEGEGNAHGIIRRHMAGGTWADQATLAGPGFTCTDVDKRVVAAKVGIPVCAAVRAFCAGDHARVVELLMPLRYHFDALGGSTQQRDVLELTLVSSCFACNEPKLAKALLAERTIAKPGSPLSWHLFAAAAQRSGDPAEASSAYQHAASLGFQQGGWNAH